MIELDLINIVFDLWLKPTIFLIVLLAYTPWTSHRSPESAHWVLTRSAVMIASLLCVVDFLPRFNLNWVPETYQFWVINYELNFSNTDLVVFYVTTSLYLLVFSKLSITHVVSIIRAKALVTRSTAAEGAEALLLKNTEKDLNACGIISRRKVNFALSDELNSPVLWSFKSTTILLPSNFQSWPKARLCRVLAHEYAHIQRNDWLVKHLGLTLMHMFWFIPSVWFINKRAQLYAEYSCDDRVVTALDCRAEYADDLLAISHGRNNDETPIDNAFVEFNESQYLFSRIQQILEPARNRECLSVRLKVLILISVFCVVYPAASLKLDYKKNPIVSFPHINIDIATYESDLGELIDNSSIPDGPININELFPRPDTDFNVSSSPIESVVLERPVLKLSKLNVIGEDMIITSDLNNPSIRIAGIIPSELLLPTYPETALVRGIEAKVYVEFDIGRDGKVMDVRLLSKTSKKYFFRAIKESLLKSRFSPVMIDSEHVVLKNVREEYVFTLN